MALLLSLYSCKPSQIPIGLSLKPEFNPGCDLTASRDSVTPRGGQGLHPACLWPALFSRLLHVGWHPKHGRLRLPSTGKWHEGLLASEERPTVLHLEIMPERMKVKHQVWGWLATDCSQMSIHLTLSDAPPQKTSHPRSLGSSLPLKNIPALQMPRLFFLVLIRTGHLLKFQLQRLFKVALFLHFDCNQMAALLSPQPFSPRKSWTSHQQVKRETDVHKQSPLGVFTHL